MLATQKVHSDAFKNGRLAPEGSVLLGILKSVESELRKRQLLGMPQSGALPLWFLAETERNIFLWRNGESIDNHRHYSFWVDIKALLVKRRQQLRRSHGPHNPFINSLWSPPPGDEDALEDEEAYLDCIEALQDSVLKHAEALSRASESVRLELAPETGGRVTIVLPARVGVGG